MYLSSVAASQTSDPTGAWNAYSFRSDANTTTTGSDFPHILFGYGYVRCCNFIRRDIDWLSKEEKDLILGGNAYRIWWE